MNITIFNSIPTLKRRLICNQATCLLMNYGFPETSMEMIASASGMKKASLYYYFSTKMDLYQHLIVQLLDYSQQNYFSITNPEKLKNLWFKLMQWEQSTIDQKILVTLPHRLTLARDSQLQSLTRQYFAQWRHFFGYTACFEQEKNKNSNFYQWCGQGLIEPLLKDVHHPSLTLET